MGFDAASFREPMDFDFTPWGGPQGTIPEPSTKDIQRYFDGLSRIKSPALPARGDGMSDDEYAEERARFDEETDAANQRAAELLADLTQQTVTADQYMGLPARVKQSFSKWLMGELSPEA